jgi:hypothetical protein
MMLEKSYQRKFLRAPFRERVLYSDSGFVHKAMALNLSEGGMLLDQLPSFPEYDDVSLLLLIPVIPSLRNFSLLKMQTFSSDIFQKQVVRVKARMVRRDELSQDLDNIFRSRFGIQFLEMTANHQKVVEDYVTTFSSNIIFLQTLIDSYNSDDEAKMKARTLAKILGYHEVEKISDLRTKVSHDYKSLQWL